MPSEYHSIAHLFGTGRSTVCSPAHETCRVIVSTLMDAYTKFLSGDALKNVLDQFESGRGGVSTVCWSH